MMKKQAVFLDRDDTLIRNIPYLGDPSRVEVLPGVRENLPRLVAAGYSLFLVSNQSGVGRGLISMAQVRAVNEEMFRRLGNVVFSGSYCCYADPADPQGMAERKPSPALIFRARDENNLELQKSFMVGDRLSDVRCGLNAGCGSVLVLSGGEDGEAEQGLARQEAHFVAVDFASAVDWMLGEGGK